MKFLKDFTKTSKNIVLTSFNFKSLEKLLGSDNVEYEFFSSINVEFKFFNSFLLKI